jgi:steroid delta-isomerase
MAHKPHPAEAYAEAFATLTPDTIDDLCGLVSDHIYFSDPFNKITGKAGFRAVFDHMYAVCDAPAFDITDCAHSETASYLRWRMTGRIKSWPHTPLNFEGMTEVRFDAIGMVTHHIDHWDSASQLLQNLPVIGWVVGSIRRLFRLPQP